MSSFAPGLSSPWWGQISLTTAIEAQANGGAGITLALVDTGVAADNPEIAGRVSPLSSCAAVTFTCSNGFDDDEGHGTATASIAGGSLNNQDLMAGVAPAVTILSEKVLDATGSGFDTDVANGIIKAADGGANVISLSLTYIPTSDIVSAINYATAKGAIIVWAAGNAASLINGGDNTTGLTPTSLNQLIIVGSVDSNNHLSSFSNTPGTASLVSSGGSASYASHWIMAPGESIIAPGIQFGGNGVFASWTGTSMSTPEVAGAVALLEATWPILKTNGDAPQVLWATATDLGATGVDSTYGNGLLNITAAFNPVGAISVFTASGEASGVEAHSAGGGGIVIVGPLGSLSGVKSILSHYTGFDAFERNFTFNLSGLVSNPSRSPNAQASFAPPLASNAISNAAGRFMAMGETGLSFGQTIFGDAGAWGMGDPFASQRQDAPAFFSFAGRNGTFVAAGHGVSPSLSFTQAAWGADSPAAQQGESLGVASALVDLAQGGYFGAMGMETLGRVRIAASWSATPQQLASPFANDRTHSDAAAAAIAVTAKVTSRLSLGITYSTLREDNGLLGSTYAGGSLLDLGAKHQSQLTAVSSAYDLGGHRSLLAEASVVSTDGMQGGQGLISSATPLKAVAWGLSFQQGGALKPGDSLSLSVRQPLRVISGEAQMVVTGVDANGEPVSSLTPVSLAPSGHETDLSIGYASPISRTASFRSEVSYRSDADNTAGLNDVAFRFGLNLAF